MGVRSDSGGDLLILLSRVHRFGIFTPQLRGRKTIEYQLPD